jgi:hypothetical protein
VDDGGPRPQELQLALSTASLVDVKQQMIEDRGGDPGSPEEVLLQLSRPAEAIGVLEAQW